MNEVETKVMDAFQAIKADLEKWGTFVDKTVVEILENEGIAIEIFPKHRIKEDGSFLFKALYRRKNYANPIQEIEDKVGTRVVLLNSDNVQKASSFLKDSTAWRAVVTRNIRDEVSEKPKIFDYQSVHLVVRPLADDPGFADPDILSCEIQTRTLLQHAFAQTSHDSTYKGPYQNDPEILRHLSKSMALMEATDDYFCRILELMSDPERHDTRYLSELSRVIAGLCPELAGTKSDMEIAAEILSLLRQKPVDIGLIEAWAEREKNRLATIICEEKSVLVSQPVFLLVDYYFRHNRNFLNENWPLNNDSLKTIYSIEGVAYNR